MHPERHGTVLLADDEAEVRSYVEMALRCHGYEVETAEDGEEALGLLERGTPVSVVLLDVLMPRKDGIETLKEIRRMNPELPVIMVSSACGPLNVVEAMKHGATDFLGKPVTHEDLLVAIRRVLDGRTKPQEAGEEAPLGEGSGATYFGNSASMKELQLIVSQVAGYDAPVLITGETGAGKEALARQIHALSPRAEQPLLKLNCAALPSELVESELFGYERGAFTGAFQKKPGMFEQADGGTILLDEIGDMDFKLQSKLLQVLQDHEFQRLGGKDTVRVDVRVLAATHTDLEAAMAENRFREDLFYRLNVVSINVPPLRERREDILPLAEFLMRRHARAGTTPPALTPALRHAFLMHNWPGNVRELENTVRRLLIFRNPDRIARELQSRASRKALVPSPVLNSEPDREPVASPPILDQVTRAKQQAETDAIVAALSSSGWNRKRAAKLLRIDYKALLYRMRKLQIEEPRSEAAARAYTPAAAGK